MKKLLLIAALAGLAMPLLSQENLLQESRVQTDRVLEDQAQKDRARENPAREDQAQKYRARENPAREDQTQKDRTEENQARKDRAQEDPALRAAEAKADLKLMSFNIRYYKPGADGDNGWVARRDACLEMIRTEAPDVIGFQEPHRPQIDFLKVNLPEYAEVDMGRDAATDIEKRPDGGEHLMIMYRRSKYVLADSGFFWISPTPDRPSRGWDAMCRRVTVWVCLRDRRSGQQFYYFNTHFDHVGKQARAEAARLVVERMKRIAGEKAAVFLSGDLNTTYDHPALEPLRAWMQSARHAAKVTDSLPTFNGFGKRGLWIDFIFARNARALAYRTLTDGARYGVPFLSDHNPIYALYKL